MPISEDARSNDRAFSYTAHHGRGSPELPGVRCGGNAHGVWLDRDQMRQIVEFIGSLGLDRARALEQERLKATRRKLAVERRIDARGAGNASDRSGDDD